jgi:hypothetical protein
MVKGRDIMARAMELGLIIIGFLYIALSVGAIVNLFLQSRKGIS